ncbi:MAG: DinB family protein [Candidatus Hodarchaeales archaeon]|jgi:hypothetical protein
MNSMDFFIDQLENTKELIVHGILIMPKERHAQELPHFTHPNIEKASWIISFHGRWPPLRVVHHLVYYEEMIALPEMEKFHKNIEINYNWEKHNINEKNDWKQSQNTDALLDRFTNVREKQRAFLKSIDDEMLNNVKNITCWGKNYFNFIINKTLQHTLSHGANLYAKSILWEHTWIHLENLN